MTITCITCHQPTYQLQPVQADIIQQPNSGEWGIDLILACPHCGLQYAAWVPNADLVPLTGITAHSRPRRHPAATFHQTHEGNK